MLGRPGALVGWHVFLLFYSAVILLLSSLPPDGSEEPDLPPEEAEAFARDVLSYVLALWTATTAGTALAIRVHGNARPRRIDRTAA